tara:strand:+ start:1526 stop:1804 length:279 start_codon:yes stop_codon:yes gene_type:complete
MAQAGVTLKIMPKTVEVDRTVLMEEVKKVITEIYGDVGETREEEEPVAFGLVAMKITFIIDESKGTDEIEEKAAAIPGVSSAKVIDFRRALG